MLAALLLIVARCVCRARKAGLAAKLASLGVPAARMEDYLAAFTLEGVDTWDTLLSLRPTVADLQTKFGIRLGHAHVIASTIARTAPKTQVPGNRRGRLAARCARAQAAARQVDVQMVRYSGSAIDV